MIEAHKTTGPNLLGPDHIIEGARMVSNRQRRYYERVSLVSFVLLFPGFFFYHFAVARGFIPQFLGGFFTPVSLLVIAAYFPLLYAPHRYKRNITGGVFALILILNLVVALLMFRAGRPTRNTGEMLVWSLTGITHLVAMYLTGRYLTKKALRVVAYFLLPMAFIVLTGIGARGFFYVALESVSADLSVATYQGFARSLLITAAAILALTARRGKIPYFTFAGISAVALFFNGARTEFALFVATFVGVHILQMAFRRRIGQGALALFFSIPMLLWVLMTQLGSSRMAQLLNIFSSSSGQGRTKKLMVGMNEVFGSLQGFLFGNYAFYVSNGGTTGGYVHNIFSAWVNLGFLGILLFGVLFILLWRDLFRWLPRMFFNADYQFYLWMLISTTGALIASKPYTYLITGLVVGLACKLQQDSAGTIEGSEQTRNGNKRAGAIVQVSDSEKSPLHSSLE